MTQRLTNLAIDRVSLVDKGANGRVIALLKRDEEGSMTDPPTDGPGLVAWLKKGLASLDAKLQPVPIAKTATFAEVVAGQELQDALWDSWYTLEDVLWGAIYAYDDNGQALSIEAKTALVAQDLDEFKAYLLAQMASATVAKSDAGSPDQRRFSAMVRKVGKKISGSRLERLNAAAEALNSVLVEVADVVEAADEADQAEETDVEKNELVAAVTEAVTKAQEPLIARIEALEKAPTTVVKTEGEGAEDDGPVTLEGLATVVEKILDRLDEAGEGKAVRKSLAGQDGAGEPVKKSAFAGILS
jgi:hypothetical protein